MMIGVSSHLLRSIISIIGSITSITILRCLDQGKACDLALMTRSVGRVTWPYHDSRSINWIDPWSWKVEVGSKQTNVMFNEYPYADRGQQIWHELTCCGCMCTSTVMRCTKHTHTIPFPILELFLQESPEQFLSCLHSKDISAYIL